MRQTTTTGKTVETMGHVQTNADRHVVALAVGGNMTHLRHYTEDCAAPAVARAEAATKKRRTKGGHYVTIYETTIRGGKVQRKLVEDGYVLYTRQDIAALGTTLTCATCGEDI